MVKQRPILQTKRLLKIFLTVIFLIINITTEAQVWSLQQCIDTAQVHNKSLQISQNNIDIGEQKHKEAIAGYIPKITANADYRYYINQPYQLMPLSIFGGGPEGEFKEAQFGVPHNINASLQLTMPLYSPAVNGAIQTTRIASEISELQYQKTKEEIYFEISILYYNAQILYNQISFIDSNLVNSGKLLINMQLLKTQLLAKGTDVSRVQLQIDQLTTQSELIKSKYEQALNALKFAIGISIEQNIEIDTNIVYLNNNEYTTSSTIAIRLAKTQNRFLSSELNTLKKTRLPSLSLFGTYGTTGFGYDKKPNDFLKFYPLDFAGVQLTYPLFNGTITQRKINQKKLEITNSELQLSILSEQNNMQINNAKQQRIVARKSVETTLSQIQLAQSVYDQTVLQQSQGTATLTDVLLADNALREAQQNYLSAVVDYLEADLNLKKFTGNISK